ncbi:MAG TPA: hypothetical protein VGB99_18310 [Acidobacteriota bacterium]
MEITSLLLFALLLQTPGAAEAPPAAAAGGVAVEYIGGQPMPAKLTSGTLSLDEQALTFKGGGAAIAVPFGDVTKLRYGRAALQGIDKSKLVPEVRQQHGNRRTMLDVQFTLKNSTSHLLLRLPNKQAKELLGRIETKTGKKAEKAKAGAGKEKKSGEAQAAGKAEKKPAQTQPE